MKSRDIYIYNTYAVLKRLKRHSFDLQPRYVLDGFPMTKRQADLMAARRIIPIRVIELQIDKDEMLRRGMKDMMKPDRSDAIHSVSKETNVKSVISIKCSNAVILLPFTGRTRCRTAPGSWTSEFPALSVRLRQSGNTSISSTKTGFQLMRTKAVGGYGIRFWMKPRSVCDTSTPT